MAATGAEAAARVRRRGVDALGQLGDDRDADPNGGRTGSCRCACPPAADGVGQCVNMRGVPEASCNDVALLGGARGFCPALGVTSTCAVPPGPAAQTRGALGGLPPSAEDTGDTSAEGAMVKNRAAGVPFAKPRRRSSTTTTKTRL